MLAQFYPPLIGGEERHVKNLSAQLAGRGHAVSVATIWHHGLKVEEQDGDVRVHRIRGTLQRLPFLFSEAAHFHAPSFPDPEFVSSLRRIVQDEQPDIVHAHNWLVYSFLPVKNQSQAKLLLTVHDHSLLCPKKKLIYNDAHCSGPSLSKCLGCVSGHYGAVKGASVIVTNRLMQRDERKKVDMFVPVSSAVGHDNDLMQGNLPVRVIPNFVPDNVGDVSPVPHAKLSQLPAGEFMLFVGAFGRYKGVDVLAKAYALLRKRVPTAPPLVIIGYQTTEYPVQTTNFPEGMLVLQDWPHEAVMQAWHRCMFGIVPSTWSDPCPTVAMEAMACGKPLIASCMGGLIDLVDDRRTGFLVPPDDPAALCEAMAKLCADPELRRVMGLAGKQKVASFQATQVVNQLEALYGELLSRSVACTAPSNSNDNE